MSVETTSPIEHASTDLPDLSDLHLAHARIRQRVRATPVLSDPGLDEEFHCRAYVKCEHLQHTGAFKFRGASNAVARLDENGTAGDVATHSSGNHGAALALAAKLSGRQAHVVMPANASAFKMEAVRQHGGTIHLCEPTQASRESGLAELVARGYIAIHPYDHPDIIAGQGTAALELLQQVPDLDVVMTPVGGGGLLAGTALAAQQRGVRVLAAEPAGAADTAASLARGERVQSWQPDTIADGLRALIGVRNFSLVQRYVGHVVTVSEQQIAAAMRLFWQHTRMLIEPSSAVVIAAVLAEPEWFRDKHVGLITTGANIEPAEWLRLTEEFS